MTTATALLNCALVTLAPRGDRPRCSDPSTTRCGTPMINTTATSPPCWCKAVPAALPGPLALPGDEPVL
jgi:hypothetical protein